MRIVFLAVPLVAGWVAAGSLGFMGHALSRALVLLAAVSLLVAGWPRGPGHASRRGALLLAFLLTPFALATGNGVSMVFAISLLTLAVAGWVAGGEDIDVADAAWAGGGALFLFGVFKLLAASNSAVWFAIERLSLFLSHVGCVAPGGRTAFGATFAGIDLLFASAAGWLCFGFRRGISGRARLWGMLLILAGHGLYLALAAGAPVLLSWCVAGELGPAAGKTVQALVPWYLPAVGGIVHLGLLAWLTLRSCRKSGSRTPDVAEVVRPWLQGHAAERQSLTRSATSSAFSRPAVLRLLRMASGPHAARVPMAILATGIAGLLFLFPGLPSLKEKKVVLYEKGFLNWKRPEHGDYGAYSAGMYGHLPDFIRSLGAEASVSAGISPEVLADADLLVLIFPTDPWTEEQKRCIWEFVRLGGSLLLMGEHTAVCDDGGNRFNEILDPAAIRVNFDSAFYRIGGWLESYETVSHPVVNGIGDERNAFGIVIGASLSISPPARPLIIGKWGFSDHGDIAGEAAMGNTRYDPGERLGDIVLAAEQRLGEGRVIVFGDTSSLCNPIAMGCEPFLSRLLAYLCDGSAGAGGGWRDAGMLVLVAAGIGICALARDRGVIVVAAVFFAALPPAFVAAGRGRSDPAPLRCEGGTPLAYIDASHNNAFSSESWRPDGIMGFALTLSRNGYLPIMMDRFDEHRLREAELLAMIAPQKSLSEREARLIEELVSQGMLLIVAVGFEDRQASAALLRRFGLGFEDLYGRNRAGLDSAERSVPLGFFKSPYLDDGGILHHVRFHAAWPVRCAFDGAEVLARGYWDLPVMISMRHGKGSVLFVGDSAFALNTNLENEDGSPFEGLRENANFWRWFFSRLWCGEGWVSPRPDGTGGGRAAGEGRP